MCGVWGLGSVSQDIKVVRLLVKFPNDGFLWHGAVMHVLILSQAPPFKTRLRMLSMHLSKGGF
jgi:hypothetical protein